MGEGTPFDAARRPEAANNERRRPIFFFLFWRRSLQRHFDDAHAVDEGSPVTWRAVTSDC